MAQRRSSVYDNVDPGLARAVQEVARTYKKYRMEPFSGNARRPRNPDSLHPMGRAMDFNLIDTTTGEVLPNIGKGHPKSAVEYQAAANEIYKWALQNDPALAKEIQWGGYFAGGSWPQDFMHIQRAGHKPAGGDWEKGFYPEQMKAMGLTSSGGLGQMPPGIVEQASATAAPAAPAGPTPDPYRADSPSSGRPSLGGWSDSPSEKGGVRFGGGGLGTPDLGKFPPAPMAQEESKWKEKLQEKLAQGIGNFGNAGGGSTPNPGVPLTPAPPYSQAPMQPVADMQAASANRDRLAKMMALLSGGKQLF